MSTITTTRAGAAAIAAVAAIHLLLAPEYFGEKPYIGLLFLAGAGGRRPGGPDGSGSAVIARPGCSAR